jgi:transposase
MRKLSSTEFFGFCPQVLLGTICRTAIHHYQSCHRRFQQWQRDGTLTGLWHALAEDLRARGQIDLSETFIDASFSSAKKGALLSARLAEEKAAKSWKIERLFAWLHNFRRLVNRWEYQEANSLAMLQLGCLVILPKHL